MLKGENRQSFSSALTHPVTIAALAVLVINDLVFKALWPGDWTTGKLSDLAWMVFAPPLLAFLMSLATPHKPAWDRAIFAVSYIGLPLLYLAYNSYEPLHDAIIGIFMLANTGTIGSPFDPTDSLVIPLGMAIAFLVWRYGGNTQRPLAIHARFLVAALASFAMVACPPPATHYGITEVGIEQTGDIVVANAESSSGYVYVDEYVSFDGGWDWEHSQPVGAINWGSDSVTTPRGTYRLDDLKILHSVDGQKWTESYSLEPLDTEGNNWAFRRDARRHHNRDPSLHPHNLVFHEPSGNVIVAWGLQGVLVNTATGLWHKVAVDRYSPIGFSFAGKSRVLLSDFNFWLALLFLSMSALALALAIAPVRGEEVRLVILLAMLVIVAFGLLLFIPGILFLLPVLVIAATVWLARKPKLDWWRKSFALYCAVLASVGSCLVILNFGSQRRGDDIEVFLFLAGLFVSPLAIIVSWMYFKHWQVIVPAFLGINLLITLSFSWWLFLGMTLVAAKTGAVTFASLGAVALIIYLKKKENDEGDSSQPLIPADSPDSSNRL